MNYRDLALDDESFRVKTDAQGRFVFPKVAPGKYEIFRIVPGPNSDGTFSAYATMTQVEIRESETARVLLGASGHFVTMRLRWPKGKTRKPGISITALLRPAEPPARVEDIFAKTRYMVEAADGTWQADDVQSGSFVLEVTAMDVGKDGDANDQLVAKSPLNISSDPGSIVEMGEIPLAQSETRR